MAFKSQDNSIIGKVRPYFTQKYAGKIGDDWSEVRRDITERFGVSEAYWYHLRTEMKKINDEAKAYQAKSATAKASMLSNELANMASESQATEEIPWAEEGENGEFVIDIPSDLSESHREAFGRMMSLNRELATMLQAKEHELSLVKNQATLIEKRNRILKDTAKDLLDAI
jgi:hypothetical protein